MNRRIFLSSILVLALVAAGCGPHHKSTPVPPGTTASPWYPYQTVGPYAVYFHKSWTGKQIQCLRVAIECHWAAWSGSRRSTLRIGAHHWGRIWVRGGASTASSPTGAPIWCSNSGPGQAIHIVVRDHRLHGLNHAIDTHQDPFQENNVLNPARFPEVDLDDVAAVKDAYAKQQFLGCH